MLRRIIGGIALMIGTTIGAGIFGIPYAFAAIGFWPGIVLLCFVVAVVIITTVAYVDLVLHAPKKLQFTGIIRTHLGNGGFFVAIITMLVGMYGALLAYTTEIGSLISELVAPAVVIEGSVFSVLFYAVACVLIAFGLKSILKTEIVFVGLIILVLIIFAALALPEMHVAHFSGLSIDHVPLAYGVLLFALLGISAIPDMVRVMKQKTTPILWVVVLGALIPAVLYILFAFTIVGVVGPATTQSAIVGFGQILGPTVLRIGAILGILTMGTSFLISGLVLREVFELDFKQPNILAFFLAMAPPLLIYLIADPGFINIISVVGAIVMGTLSIIILVAWLRLYKKAGKKALILKLPPVIIWGLMGVFVLGLVFEIVDMIS